MDWPIIGGPLLLWLHLSEQSESDECLSLSLEDNQNQFQGRKYILPLYVFYCIACILVFYDKI